MQTGSSRVSGNGCDIYEGSVRVPPASPTSRNARREAGLRDKHATGAAHPTPACSRWTDRQTGILCWMPSGSLPPPAAQRYVPAGSSAPLIFSRCQLPGETHTRSTQKHQRSLAKSSHLLPVRTKAPGAQE